MNKSNALSFAAAPGVIRQIVLDYLCTNCYADTAKVFARESCPRTLDKDGEEMGINGDDGNLENKVLHMVQMRKEIKMQLLDGRISDAIDLLNMHFPDVLSPKTVAPGYLAPNLYLNLRIQNFVEEARTIPLPWPQELFIDSNMSTQKSSPSIALKPLVPNCALQTGPSGNEERNNRLLNLMNELYCLERDLPSRKDRATYDVELSAVGGLLAYPVPEKSREVRKYLAMERREALADQINEAIMSRTNQSVPTTVELITRHTTVIYSTLNALKHVLPPFDQRPPGLEALLPLIKHPSHETSQEAKTATTEKELPEIIPKFELEVLMSVR